jgi:hypothetical protein
MQSLWNALTDAVQWMLQTALPLSSMRLVSDDPRRLEIDTFRGLVVLDARRRVISRRERVIVRFDEIKFIVLIRERRGEYSYEWAVRLYKGPFAYLKLGACEDDLDASLIAARLSKALDVPVKSW